MQPVALAMSRLVACWMSFVLSTVESWLRIPCNCNWDWLRPRLITLSSMPSSNPNPPPELFSYNTHHLATLLDNIHGIPISYYYYNLVCATRLSTQFTGTQLSTRVIHPKRQSTSTFSPNVRGSATLLLRMPLACTSSLATTVGIAYRVLVLVVVVVTRCWVHRFTPP